MSAEIAFNLIPLTFDANSENLRLAENASTTSTATSDEIVAEIEALNNLHHALISNDTVTAAGGVPPPPVPVDPKRTNQVNKMRESGNDALRRGRIPQAVHLYDLAIKMAAGRPVWEPAALMRMELSQLYANRAQAHIVQREWPEGAIDALCSVKLKKTGNMKAWYRRGKCLLEMGRLHEARDWIQEALENEQREGELEALLREVNAAFARRK